VDQFSDPRFWPDAFPVLFPFGVGGAVSKDRPTKISLSEWIRHMLAYHDGRFRKDPSFLYVAFAIMQVRERLTMSRVLYKKIFSPGATVATNAPTSAELQTVLELMKDSKSLYGLGAAADSVRKMLTNTSIVGSKLKGSVYERAACRNEIIGMVTLMGLPNLFITINPSDINNPIVCFWNTTTGDPLGEFNLSTLVGDFPTEAQRAKLVSEDPVLPAMFFDTVIDAFLKAFLGFEKPAGPDTGILPKGKLLNPTLFTGSESRGLKGFYGTVECQGRGSLHLHLLVWLHGLPTPEGAPFPPSSLLHQHPLLFLHLPNFNLSLMFPSPSSIELGERIRAASAAVTADLANAARAADRASAGLPGDFFNSWCFVMLCTDWLAGDH
jgi:hypothetical protein